MCFFWRLLIQIKKLLTIGIFNHIFEKRFITFKEMRHMGQLCWNYGLSKLLLHFIEYLLGQLNNKHIKVAVNLTIQYFEGFPTQNGSPVKFVLWNKNHILIANILKLHKYQTFGLMKMNMCKIWYANRIFSLLRWNKKLFSWFLRDFSCRKLSCPFNYIGY